MRTILIIGATGLLGHALGPYLKNLGKYRVVLHGHTHAAELTADVSRPKDAMQCLSQINPDIVINLAALTNVDVCEVQLNDAYRINTAIVENVVSWIKAFKPECHLIQISTDHLYEAVESQGAATEQGSKEEVLKLVNVYALSKYAGEIAARGVNSTVLRTNFFGKSHVLNRVSFTDWLYGALIKREEIKVFTDVFFSPLSIATLVEMIELSVTKRPLGTLNLGSRFGMSKAAFAFEFARALGLDETCLTPMSSAQATFLKTSRPKDMRMDSSKFELSMGVVLPSLANEIENVARSYRAEA